MGNRYAAREALEHRAGTAAPHRVVSAARIERACNCRRRRGSCCEWVARGVAPVPGVGVGVVECVERPLRRNGDRERDGERLVADLDPKLSRALAPEQGYLRPERLALSELAHR